jgi:iron complex transport system substrate-binding protein
MRLDRRSLTVLLASAALAPGAVVTRPPSVAAASRRTVTDMVGRTVELSRPAERIVLLDGRDILAMAMVHPAPSSLVVGWAGAELFDSDVVRAQYTERPDGSEIPRVGGQAADTISVESVLALAPDLVVATAHVEPELEQGALTRRLAEAGIPVIFSNAASNRPGGEAVARNLREDTGRLMRMWGTVLDKRQEAEAFVAFVDERLDRTQERLRDASRPKAYLEVQSTYDDCCWAAGTSVWGRLLALAGGRNLSVLDAPWYAKLSIEQLMTEAPQVYIACGGAYAAGMRPAIGPGLDPERGRAGLHRLCERTGFQTLPAVRDGRVHGIWTGLVTVQPLNLLFVEAAAKWLHPEAFEDADPERTLEEVNRRFLTQPLPGPCWLSL